MKTLTLRKGCFFLRFFNKKNLVRCPPDVGISLARCGITLGVKPNNFLRWTKVQGWVIVVGGGWYYIHKRLTRNICVYWYYILNLCIVKLKTKNYEQQVKNNHNDFIRGFFIGNNNNDLL